MSHFKTVHLLARAEGGEGRIPATEVDGYSWTIRHMGGNHYKIYLESPDKFTITGATPDKIGLPISKLFRLNRIEWSFDDNTSKSLDILLKRPHVNQLGYPTRLVDLDSDTNEDGYKIGGLGYEMEGGTIIEFQITGTATKLFSPVVYIQILDNKK